MMWTPWSIAGRLIPGLVLAAPLRIPNVHRNYYRQYRAISDY
jgi:hypothetical protein